MNKEVLSRALDQIDEKYTEEAVLYPGSDDGDHEGEGTGGHK